MECKITFHFDSMIILNSCLYGVCFVCGWIYMLALWKLDSPEYLAGFGYLDYVWKFWTRYFCLLLMENGLLSAFVRYDPGPISYITGSLPFSLMSGKWGYRLRMNYDYWTRNINITNSTNTMEGKKVVSDLHHSLIFFESFQSFFLE